MSITYKQPLGKFMSKSNPKKEIWIELEFENGKCDYIKPDQRKSGIYLSVQPVTKSEIDGISGYEYPAYSGMFIKLYDGKKYSKRMFNIYSVITINSCMIVKRENSSLVENESEIKKVLRSLNVDLENYEFVPGGEYGIEPGEDTDE